MSSDVCRCRNEVHGQRIILVKNNRANLLGSFDINLEHGTDKKVDPFFDWELSQRFIRCFTELVVSVSIRHLSIFILEASKFQWPYLCQKSFRLLHLFSCDLSLAVVEAASV